MVFSGEVFAFLALFSAIGFANGEFEIVEPFPPANDYPIEFTSTQTTCIAYDSSGSKVPESIQFVRKDKFAVYINLTANENIYFTNKTEENGRKLFVTFHIRNVTIADDSQSDLGRYECHAYAVGDPQEERRGFNLNVIRSDEIPKLLTSKVNILQHGKESRIYCNITDKGSQATKLRRMLWFKDDELVENTPDNKITDFNPLVIRNVGVKDAGNYTCVLEMRLRGVKHYSVRDTTLVSIAPWIEHLKGEKEAHVGENLTLQCSPQGVPIPLNVEWKVKKENDENVTACVDSSTDERYKISHNGTYDLYLLTIANLSRTDSGDYYCCLPSNCSHNTAEDLCQKLTLSVTVEDAVISDGAKVLASWGVVLTMVAFFVFRFHF